MQVPCEIDQVKTLKKGMKITLAVEEDNVKKVMQDIHSFIDMPLEVDFQINSVQREKELRQISPEMRKKIYAIFRDINSYSGQGIESIKREMKRVFVGNTEYEMFSLSDCSRDLAGDFIEFLIRFCFRSGYPITDNPREAFEDIERYIRICLKEKRCCVCGKPYEGDPHHVDTIGMGHNRKKVDDSKKLKLPLCYEEHHPEVHTIGDQAFCEKYHVKPVRVGD